MAGLVYYMVAMWSKSKVGRLLLLVLVGVPLIEIAVFIQVGGIIGLWPTIAVVVLTAVIGAALLRQQGSATLTRAQREMAEHRIPVRELFDAVCLLLAGALLLTPGFVTDLAGFALLVPLVRRTLGMRLWRLVQRHADFRAGGGFETGPTGSPPVIDGDFQELDPGRGDEPRAGRG